VTNDYRSAVVVAHDNEPTEAGSIFDMLRRPAFFAGAACRGCDPAMFYPERGEAVAPAKAVCQSCPVAKPCLEYALAGGEKFGLWGGTSERERRRMRKDRAAIKRQQPAALSPALAPRRKRGSEEARQLRDERRLLIGVLREQGLTLKAIAAGGGITMSIVTNDLAALRLILGD